MRGNSDILEVVSIEVKKLKLAFHLVGYRPYIYT